MIKSFFKICFILIATFLFYSVPYKGTPIFDLFSDYGSEWANDTNRFLAKKFNESFSTTQEVGKQLFLNTSPPKKILRDAIKSQQSAFRKSKKEILNESAVEDIDESSRSNLNRLIDESEN